ncbi:MAG: B12-binding domain-containing radical SAM protein [Deltaproteobacteria bacterium]|nr:B12-binding domain-containing radical SAM protein [Deltaproteobacteria bacterium]
MKILLIKSGNLNTRAIGITPPLGLMYIASYVRNKRGDEVRIFDIRFYKEPLKEIYHIISEFGPDIIGISALTLEASAMYQIAHFVKIVTDVPVIAGGPHATSVPEEVMKNEDIDIVIIGEGEITFKELLDNLDKGQGIEMVHGIGYRKDNDTILTHRRNTIEHLDIIPFPSWDLIELGKYAETASMSIIGYGPYMVLLTSRGCPFHCTYCHNIMGKTFRARSVENVLDEMRILIEKHHINDFEIIDDISNFDRERFKQIMRGIISNGWKVALSFPNGVRTDLLDDEAVRLMRQAGTAEVSIAVETATPRLQKMVKKNLNLERVQHIIDVCVNEGMYVRGFFMLGFPTETEEEVKTTIDFACKSRMHGALFFLVNPFGGTELANQVEGMGKMPSVIKYEDFDYHAISFNASSVSDKKLHRLYATAWMRFYFNPKRIFRILKAKTTWNDLPYYFYVLLKNLFTPKGNQRLVLEPVDVEFKKINKKRNTVHALSKPTEQKIIIFSAVDKKYE